MVKKIWIVDDDEEMSQAIQLMLRLLDCETSSYFKPFSEANVRTYSSWTSICQR